MPERARRRRAANRLVLLAAVPLFLLLALAAFLVVQFAGYQRQAQSLVRHTYEVIGQLGAVLDDARDAETGQRGFLLTGDARFLEPYREARTRIDTHLATFRAMTRDNPTQQARAERLEEMIQARLSAFDASLSANRASASPALVAALEEGKRRMDALRAEVDRGVRAEQYLLAARERERIQTENLEVGFAIGAGGLTLGILLGAAVLLARSNVGLERARQAQAQEAGLLRTTLETLRDGIAYFAADRRLGAYNANFFTLLNLPVAGSDASLSALLAAAGSDGPVIFAPPSGGNEVKRLVRGGRQLDIYKAPVPTGGFLIGVVDETKRLEAESAIRQAQKMEAIGHLTGGVAHDFNNLLQIISANLELAAAVRVPELAPRLQNAIGAVARGSRLTAQLLAFARRQALEPRSVELGRVIRDMGEMLRRTLGETIEVETVVAGGLWNTLVDRGQVENMLLNLAINARDAMPDGGKLTLEVANAYLDDAYAAAHNEVAAGQYVMLAVTDTGIGMPADIVARVFEPFFTTKPEGKGTGLGLAQTYGFIKQSGGHIKIYSEPGEGTTVKIYLPRTPRDADADTALGGGRVEGGAEHILVVEDDDGVRAAVCDMLLDLGYRVGRASDAQTALALLQKERPDMIFTDVVMPGPIATREFARQAQEMYPGLPVLYTSGYTQNAVVHNGRLDEDAVLLSKPYSRDQLARKLREVFAGSTHDPEPSTPQIRGKVLVVEDVVLIRSTEADMVRQMGFEAVEAGDGREALALLRQDAAITALLTDLGLPGMSGLELVEEAWKHRPGLKVVIASGFARPPDLPDRVTCLLKPFEMQQLKKALES